MVSTRIRQEPKHEKPADCNPYSPVHDEILPAVTERHYRAPTFSLLFLFFGVPCRSFEGFQTDHPRLRFGRYRPPGVLALRS